MSAEVETPEILVFTDSAANKVRELIEEEGNPRTSHATCSAIPWVASSA